MKQDIKRKGEVCDGLGILVLVMYVIGVPDGAFAWAWTGPQWGGWQQP